MAKFRKGKVEGISWKGKGNMPREEAEKRARRVFVIRLLHALQNLKQRIVTAIAEHAKK